MEIPTLNIITAIGVIVTAIGVIVAVAQIAFLIYKNVSDNVSLRRRDTIRAYNRIYRQMSELKGVFKDITGDTAFNAESIKTSNELSNKVMDYLTQIESFAVGIKLKVYTFDVFERLTSEDICKNLTVLIKYIEYKRNETNYNKLFDESWALIHEIEYIQDCKRNNIKPKHDMYKHTTH
jgi:hypothetical protein